MANNLWKSVPASQGTFSADFPWDDSLSLEEAAELYADDVIGNGTLYGSFAGDPATLEDLLLVRGLLERAHYEPDAATIKADKRVLEEGISPHYAYVSHHGPEWPFHLSEIHAGAYSLDKLPIHLREFAKEKFYKVPSEAGKPLT